MNFFKELLKNKKDNKLLSDIEYIIGKRKVILPANHALPRFQKEHKLYDKFLPILAKHLPADKIIVDVGANVGDTLISMLEISKNRFYCVEPSEDFYQYLKKNILSLQKEQQSQIEIFNNLIGTNKFSGKLVENNLGTASLKISDDKISSCNTISLDELLNGNTEVILIKVDTDGYDFDVLLSGKTVCRNERPILYWENEVQTSLQKQGYDEMYEFLESSGYKHIFIFDNFGNIMVENTDFKVLSDLTEYVYSMNNNNSTRTIYYNDVMAVCPQYLSIAISAINEYKQLIKS